MSDAVVDNSRSGEKRKVVVSNKRPRSNTASSACRGFLAGHCARGSNCKFEHVAPAAAVVPVGEVSAVVEPVAVSTSSPAVVEKGPRENVCFAFQKGSCHRGDKCRFKHTLSSAEQSLSPTLEMPAVAAAPVTSSVVKAHQAHAHSASSTSSAPPTVSSAIPLSGHLSTVEFASLPNVSSATRKALAEVLRYQFMTQVQAASLPVILSGKDCLAKAKTGTGKTLAFLIPAIERMVHEQSNKGKAAVDLDLIPTLVISPNRELAIQIAAEANALLSFHSLRKQVICVYGGVKISKDLNALRSGQPLAVLVATPGRLIDHLLTTPGFAERLQSVRTVVLDEADQLLDMGFKPAIDRIFSNLPSPQQRQTLLFSATIPREVRAIADQTLNRDYAFVDTVGEVEDAQTHVHVAQSLCVLSESNDLLATLLTVLRKHIAENTKDYKVIVFFTTARVAGFYAQLCAQLCQLPVLELHSRLSQSVRQRTSDSFRNGKQMLLFSSDVSARGLDYPDVSLVVQIGSTDKSQYIHRLGRTARAGKEGEGLLLLYPFEGASMKQTLKGLPISETTVSIGSQEAAQAQQAIARVRSMSELSRSAEQAYQAWLGYYNGKLRDLKWGKDFLVQQAAVFSTECGLTEVPELEAKTVGKMGLRGTPGLRIAKPAKR